MSVVVWQDLRYQAVSVRTYLIFAVAALAAAGGLAIQGEAYAWLGHAAGMGIGLGMIGLWKASRGEVGLGDGCFFLISGLLLDFWENIMLLCYGILFCGVYCLGLFAWGMWKKKSSPGKQTVPFLPFVALPGIWLIWQNLTGSF